MVRGDAPGRLFICLALFSRLRGLDLPLAHGCSMRVRRVGGVGSQEVREGRAPGDCAAEVAFAGTGRSVPEACFFLQICYGKRRRFGRGAAAAQFASGCKTLEKFFSEVSP